MIYYISIDEKKKRKRVASQRCDEYTTSNGRTIV